MEQADWEKGYQPWSLVVRAMLTIGKQAAILLFTYSQVSAWNSANHKVMMNCRRDWVGGWAYPCEATKAFARSFPLIAASISMATASRFILQSRLFYHLIRRGALLDYDNYRAVGDTLALVLAICFLCSLLHFVLDLCLPPFNTWEKLSDVGTVYIAPCCVFWVLFDSLSDVERHFVPLTRFYEDDPAWAKAHLAKSEMYQEATVKRSAEAGRTALRAAHGRSEYTLDELLDETLKASEVHSPQHGAEAIHGRLPQVNLTLLKGLWPARLLLDQRLSDQESTNFRRAWLSFNVLFVLVQATVVALLLGSAWQEALDSQPHRFPADAVKVSLDHYQSIGEGYCREDGMRRPDGYYGPLANLADSGAEPQPEPGIKEQSGRITKGPKTLRASGMEALRRAEDTAYRSVVKTMSPSSHGCAMHCSETKNCAAFAVDLDLCNIYLRSAVAGPAPEGWHEFTEKPGDWNRWNLPSVIMQTNGARGAECWIRLEPTGEPQDIGGCIVHLLHALFVIFVAVLSVMQTGFRGKG